jgi:hypothetical protein
MLRSLVALVGLVAIATVALPGPANALFWTDTQDIYEYSIGGTISWDHPSDPYATPAISASVTIVADDVDGPGSGYDGEQDQVYFLDQDGSTWHYLGLLNDMGYYSNWAYSPGPGNPNQGTTSTTFALDPLWIDHNSMQVRIETGWGVEIETSTLTVEHPDTPGAAPEPTSLVLLGIAGGAMTAALKRRKAGG